MGIFQLTDNIEKEEIVNTNVDNKEPINNQEEKQEQEIKLDGPLSVIYAKALNLAYSRESTDTMLPNSSNEEKGSNNEGIYVYCCNGDELDYNELNNATDNLRLALDSKKYKKIIAVIESRNSNNKIGLLDEYAHNLGIETIFNRNVALDKLNNYSNNKKE